MLATTTVPVTVPGPRRSVTLNRRQDRSQSGLMLVGTQVSVSVPRGLVVINYLPNLLKRNIRAIAQRRPALVERYPALRRARHISGRTSVIPASVHRFRPCPIPARSSQSSSQHQNRNRNQNQNQTRNQNRNRNRMLPVMVAIN